METFKNYISTSGRVALPTAQYVDDLLKEYPWFGMAHMMKSRVLGVVDPLTALLLYGRAVPQFFMQEYDNEDVMRRSDHEIIESFLSSGEHRIIPNEQTPEFLEGVVCDETLVVKPILDVTAPLQVVSIEDVEDKIVEAECGEYSGKERENFLKNIPVQSDVIAPVVETVVNFLPDEDDEFVTEELAQVYFEQELFDQSKAIYSRLSLLNPEKSVYFAEIINRIELFKSAQEEL